ncbi:amino acid adenylation domain-containing protein [Iningainema tapete]|uniref:Amino acid adenylation domain-containing protein n=1 Tax=Iningainema tapete BLCC-T55 TaxID=2748662 RepID=A0A8J6XE42_9CYAN|nr:amino acid adenylation domain-containing protein [Iningainema tapete]MBD2774620.1 amino acid adenylation domain-containing protein [Iningainema tapete BLCC-T55]
MKVSFSSSELQKYWEKYLSGELPVLELPTSSPRSAIKTYNCSAYTFVINNRLTALIKQLANSENVGIYPLFLAAFKVLLYRYTNEKDILVALLLNEQDKTELKKKDNVVVSRDLISENTSFKNFLHQVSHTILEIREYQDYPFALLVNKLQSKSNSSYSPICQASFAFVHVNRSKTATQKQPPNCSQPILFDGGIPQEKVEFDLSLKVIEAADSFLCDFKYNSNLLNAATIAQFSAHYQNLLESIVSNPEQSVAQLPLLSESEREKILVEWNATGTDFDSTTCLHQLIEAQVERTPDALAVSYAGEQLTYRELNQRANQLAHYLQTLGVKPEVLVGICIERSVEMLVGLLGILKAGAAYLPLDPGYPLERLELILSDSQVPVLLSDRQKLFAHHEHRKVVCLRTHQENIATHSQSNPAPCATAENLAYVIYTSGSTGKPKGVEITHRAVVNFLQSMQYKPGITESDVLLAVTTVSFDIAALELYLPLITGASVVLAQREVASDGRLLKELINTSGATVMQATPASWRMLLAAGWSGSSQLKILCGGEGLTNELAKHLLAKGAELWNLYGPTETTIWSTVYKVEAEKLSHALAPIGRPIANTQIYILDEHQQPVPVGVKGELYIGGVGVARGYLNRSELTAQKFITNPFLRNARFYKTGDLARYLDDGNIEYISRIDNQVKIRGFRIELGEIENTLSAHPQVREAVVITSAEQSEEKQIVAYITTNQEQPTPEILRDFLKQKLPEYMIPVAFVRLDALPLTDNGKVNRRALPKPTVDSFSQQNEFVPPRNDTERKLAKIWSEILNIQPIGVKDNFFVIGGNSLSAIYLIAAIRQQFGKELPLSAVLTNPTIEEFAFLIDATDTFDHSPLIPIQPKGNKPPIFCVHPAGGNVMCYFKLAQYLGGDQPFYGLQAQGFYEEEPLTRVEDMASLYIQAIQKFQPNGPYQIGGWSFGGVVAYEMAQQLRKQGYEVSLLAILDSYVPILLDKNKKIDAPYLVGALSRYFGGMLGQDNLVTYDEMKHLSANEQINYILDKAEEVKILPPSNQSQQNRRILDVLVGTIKATYSYVRQPYPGKVTVFRAREKHIMANDPTLVWVEFFSILDAEDIKIIDVPGNHYTFILEPHLQVVAERLKSCLAQF